MNEVQDRRLFSYIVFCVFILYHIYDIEIVYFVDKFLILNRNFSSKSCLYVPIPVPYRLQFSNQ